MLFVPSRGRDTGVRIAAGRSVSRDALRPLCAMPTHAATSAAASTIAATPWRMPSPRGAGSAAIDEGDESDDGARETLSPWANVAVGPPASWAAALVALPGAGSRRSRAANAITSAGGSTSSSARRSRSCTAACCSAPARLPLASSVCMSRSATRESYGSSAARLFHHSAARSSSRFDSASAASVSSARAYAAVNRSRSLDVQRSNSGASGRKNPSSSGPV
jgi:hypothetical protein